MRRSVNTIFAVILPVVAMAHAAGTQEGWRWYYRGEYDKAIAVFEQSSEVSAIVGRSLALQELGNHREAVSLLQQFHTRHPQAQLAHRLGELEVLKGNYQEGQQRFEEALRLQSDFMPAILERAILLWHFGEREDARRQLNFILDQYHTRPSLAANEVLLAARAAVYLERPKDANRLFAEAVRLQPENWTLYLPWGELFLEKYNYPEATEIFQDALARNANCAGALLGLARATAASDLANALNLVKRALALNGDSPQAQTTLAEMLLMAGEIEEAASVTEQVLADYPRYLPALALQAVLADRHNDSGKVEMVLAQAAVNLPADASLLVRLGEDTAKRYLFNESVDYFRRALVRDPENWQATAGLGTSLSRLGKKEQARQHLQTAYNHDPFNAQTVNLLNLFDEMATYDTIRTAHFLIRLHPDDAEVIGSEAAQLCEQAFLSLASRYAYQPSAPITVEIFPKHDDFAVRCFGLPGAQVFLGICFGPLIAMDSPRAREQGHFNWQETLWHEIAHVVHLDLTANRIPRWLAEGIAVYEAAHARSEWGMNMELEMIRALQDDRLLPLAELDQGFSRRPEMVSLVYYQASQIIEYIVETYGFAKVLQLLPLFRADQSTEQAIAATFAMPVADFDAAFRTFLHAKFQPQTVVLDAKPLANAGADDFRRRAEAAPKNFFAALRYGQQLMQAGDYSAAETYLGRAQRLVPSFVARDGTYDLLADIYWQTGRRPAAVRQLEFMSAHNGKAFDESYRLYQWQLQMGDTLAAAQALARALAIYPYDASKQKALGDCWMALEKPLAAAAAYRALVGLRPSDLAGAHCSLAEALLATGEKQRAKKEALLALEIAPAFEKAQEILLLAVE